MSSLISNKAKIGKGTVVGTGAVIHDNVVIGKNCRIGDYVTIGEPLDESCRKGGSCKNPKTVIGDGSLIRSYSVIYAGCEFGAGFKTGHHCVIRENTKIGKNSVFGTFSQCDGKTTIGDNVLIHNNVFLATFTTVGSRARFYPFSMTLDSVHPPCGNCRKGPSIGEGAVIGGGVVILPNVKIGKSAVIGAGTVVAKDVEPDVVVYSAAAVKCVRKSGIKCKTGKGVPFRY